MSRTNKSIEKRSSCGMLISLFIAAGLRAVLKSIASGSWSTDRGQDSVTIQTPFNSLHVCAGFELTLNPSAIHLWAPHYCRGTREDLHNLVERYNNCAIATPLDRCYDDPMAASSACVNSSLELRPSNRWTTLPSRRIKITGSSWTPYCKGVFGLASTSSCAIVARPANSPTRPRIAGFISKQGTHRADQKSISTG